MRSQLSTTLWAAMETPAEQLKKARIARGYASAREAARSHGWNEVTYIAHENGTRGLRVSAARRYAVAYGVSVAELMGIQGHEPTPITSGVSVIGEAAVGLWRDPALQMTDDQTLPVPDGDERPRFAVRIADTSVNKLLMPGEFAVCEPIDAERVQPGHIVVIRRRRDGLDELSVRRVSARDGERIRVAGYSTDNRYNGLTDVDVGPDAVLLGRVIGKYAPFGT